MNKDYEAEDIYWYHAIYEMTDSESEAIELFFKICDEILHEISEEDLKKIVRF